MAGIASPANVAARGARDTGTRWRAALLITIALLVAACSGGDDNEGNLPNPASVYCEENGGKLEIRTGDDGEYGVCVFPDGSECDEWAYFRGECEPGDA